MNPAKLVASKRAWLDAARGVQRNTGKSVASQLREIVRLRRGPGMLRASDYYAYHLYDDARYTPAEKLEFVHWPRTIGLEVNDRRWAATCDDKLTAYALFRGLGLPYPEVYAVYHSGGRAFGSAPTLRTPDEMSSFLRAGMRYPFFAKPSHGQAGGGASAVMCLDEVADRLVLANGESLGVDDYVRDFISPGGAGYLFQETIRQHPSIERVSGTSVASLRIVVFNYEDGPRLFRAFWKIPAGGNITDNFLHGTSGNLLACIDVRHGVVEHVVQGPGRKSRPVYTQTDVGFEVECHPDTGERVLGFALPHWEETVAVCLRAAAFLVGLRYQSFDVVMCSDGPAILEINSNGSIMQVPGCRGFNDDQFRDFFAKYARTAAK